MDKLYCPKKSFFNCAWCSSSHTTVVSANPKGYPRMFPDYIDEFDHRRFYKEDHFDGFPYNIYPDDRKVNNKFPLIIHCLDCYKYSKVDQIKCRICRHNEIKISRLESKIDLDIIFNPIEDNICSMCKMCPPTPYCEHKWVRHSGEIFSSCVAINLVCTKCGAKKTKTSNDDRDPFSY